MWAIAWKAKNGDARAKEALDRLLEVAERLGVRQYFEERIRPVMLAGTKSAVGRKVAVEGVAVEITGFKVEWVKLEDPNEACNWPKELCRPKVTVEYAHGGRTSKFTTTWGMARGAIRAGVGVNTLDRAAVLIAVAVWEGDEVEVKRIVEAARRGGGVILTLDNLLAMAQYDEALLEWAMRIRRTASGDARQRV